MKRALAVIGLLCLVSGAAIGQKDLGTTKDLAAIRAVVDHWQEMWSKLDASVLTEDYAVDADWQNAFGIKKKGSAAILAFMTTMVKRPNVQARHTTWDEPKIRFLRPDVAVAYRDYRTTGHVTVDGKQMPQRNTHSTWLLTKEAGKWHIASQVISDEVQ